MGSSIIPWIAAFHIVQSTAAPQVNLSLVLSCGTKPGEVRLTIRNPDQTDTSVLIGTAMANGQWYLPREVVVDVKREGSSDVEQLVYSGPVNLAGRMDHWVVALPAEATFALTLNAEDFVAISPGRTGSPPEELTVRLTGRPITSDLNVDMTGMKAWRVWTGSARSNPLKLSDCPR